MFNKFDILDFVKLDLEITDDDNDKLLERYIDKAYSDITIYCNNDFTDIDEEGNEVDTFPEALNSVVEDLVIMRYRDRGREGLLSEKMGDYSYTKSDKKATGDLPTWTKDRLKPFRKVRFY